MFGVRDIIILLLLIVTGMFYASHTSHNYKSSSFELKYQRDNVRDSILHLFYVARKACSAH